MENKIDHYFSHLKDGLKSLEFSYDMTNEELKLKTQRDIIKTLWETTQWIETEANKLKTAYQKIPVSLEVMSNNTIGWTKVEEGTVDELVEIMTNRKGKWRLIKVIQSGDGK